MGGGGQGESSEVVNNFHISIAPIHTSTFKCTFKTGTKQLAWKIFVILVHSYVFSMDFAVEMF